MTDTPARAYTKLLAASTPQSAAALTFSDLVADVDARRAAIHVHHFESTAAASDAADHDEMANGDVFVVESEKVVGFIVVICPAILTEERGTLPHLPSPGREYMEGEYTDSVVVAEREARARGFLLRDEDPQDRIRSMRHLKAASVARITTDPDPDNEEWQTALARLTVAQTYLNEHDPGAQEAMDASARRIADDLKRIDEEYGTNRRA
ncbi:hypothetical protein ACFWVB_02475 [Streptomyces microflavus]|uniref:hypothetical protein n=1 Tax=Streptomyces microflavus TaxID=1919 RepID=UPI00365967A7